MAKGHGGSRPGAGRKRGSRNKSTIARQMVAKELDVSDPERIETAVHNRGGRLLMALEQIALDEGQPVGIRISAAKAALPFLVPKLTENVNEGRKMDDIVRAIQDGRHRVGKPPHPELVVGV